MKLIKQKVLYFSEGNSDKVYEADLCETQDLFVVNFRYGRRGANLREGTKTVFPVSYEEAETIFNKLILSKERKGYSEVQGEVTTKKENKEENTIQKETILKYLQQAIKGTYTRNWKVSRIIARVGVLNIKEATPLLAQFIKSSDEFEQYNAISVLGDFNEAKYTKEILTVFNQNKFDTIVGRIASAYILKFGEAKEIAFLKETVSKYITEEDVKTLAIEFLDEKNKNPMLLYYAYVYAYNNETLREEVYKVLNKVPLKVNTFKSIRYIYRSTYLTNDRPFFALLSKRITMSNAGYTSEYPYIKGTHNWVYAYEEKQKENPRIAFSGKTRSYFNKHSYKKVYHLSLYNQEAYIEYAKEVLSTLNDEKDNAISYVDYGYEYNETTRRYETEKRYYPKYHQFLVLMYVLYGNSNRFQHQKNKWFYIENSDENIGREEILTDVWNEKPQEVLYILANTKSEVAVDFSLKIIEENPSFLETIPEGILTKLLSHYHPKVLEIMVEVLEKKYKTTQPEDTVIIRLLCSKNDKSVTLGLRWLQEYEASCISKETFLSQLLVTNEVKVIDYLIERYKNEVAYKTILSIDTISVLFEESSVYDFNFLIQVNHLIGNTLFGTLLNATSVQKIRTLAASSSITNKLFAINLAKQNNTPAYELFKEMYDEYIASDEELLRKAGIEILVHFPDHFLLENKQNMVRYCFSEYPEVRQAVRPTIDKLIKLDSAFKKSLLKQLLLYITEAESYEGLHENCYEILTQFYGENLEALSEKEILELVISKYDFAQKLGTPLFEKRVSMSSLSMDDLVRLAYSDVVSIRVLLHDYFKKNVARLNYELEAALRIFNTHWQDVIDWSCNYFGTQIDAKNWTVDMLLYTCDHVKEQVQSFGRSMVTKHFSDEKGLPLLISLQEHPAKGMQFFVTNYLHKYATDNVEVILQLENYFKTTLFYVNTNRATKTRVYTFLEKESIKHEEVAVMAVRILTAVLDTKTIVDKDQIIDLLLTISETHPHVEIPLLIQQD